MTTLFSVSYRAANVIWQEPIIRPLPKPPATTLLPARAMKARRLGTMVSVKAPSVFFYWASELRLRPLSTCSENVTAPSRPRTAMKRFSAVSATKKRETGWNRKKKKTLPPSLADIDNDTLLQISRECAQISHEVLINFTWYLNKFRYHVKINSLSVSLSLSLLLMLSVVMARSARQM